MASKAFPRPLAQSSTPFFVQTDSHKERSWFTSLHCCIKIDSGKDNNTKGPMEYFCKQYRIRTKQNKEMMSVMKECKGKEAEEGFSLRKAAKG